MHPTFVGSGEVGDPAGWPWPRLWPDRYARAFLILTALLFVALDVLGAVLGGRTTGALGPFAGLALQLVADLSLLVVLRIPYVVVGFLTAGALADVIAPGLFVPTLVVNGSLGLLAPTGVAIFVLVQIRNRRLTWVFVAVLTLLAVRVWDPGWDTVPLGLLGTAVTALAGRHLAARRRILDDLRERAERTDREQRLLADRARAEERARLASEMHDVVTHRVTLMVLQAGALEVTGPEISTETAREAARTLRESGMVALDELRELVRVLHTPEPVGASPRVGPGGGEPDLRALVAASAAAGMAVELDGDDLPEGAVGRTAHRVVQEALTNAHKHAPGSVVRIRVRCGEDLVVSVRNSAPDAPLDGELAASGSGTGLRGLHERVSITGGTLEAGPRADGGFEVRAVLPGAR
ncbi:histidine kinase [Pseudonocardia ailaonensis]|uniref:histidine kinase n=1 Tax=Pseudonocardia ailaonensis TaxID=367279 RepID=A0ABN2NNE4_9PSEU